MVAFEVKLMFDRPGISIAAEHMNGFLKVSCLGQTISVDQDIIGVVDGYELVFTCVVAGMMGNDITIGKSAGTRLIMTGKSTPCVGILRS
jgi:hypothetical protein